MMEMLLALAIGLIGTELWAWLPSIVSCILRAAVRRLPEDVRDRYYEEWSAEAAAIPGRVGQLIWTVSLLRASVVIRREMERGAGQLLLTDESMLIGGIPSGLTDLDDKLGGLQPSDLVILAARPSMGKTALALTIASNATKAKAIGPDAEGLTGDSYAVGFFSLEMSAEQLGMRLLSSEAQMNSDDLRRGKLMDTDFKAVVQASQDLATRPLFIDDTPALSVGALRTRARRLKRRQGLSLLVVDYLQLVRPSTTSSQSNRVQEIAEITQGLKAIAKELNVPVLALSQLSRAVEQREDKRPQLSDLRESAAIEQDADVVMFVYRDEYYHERAEPKQRPEESSECFRERYESWRKRYEESRGVADLIIAKQRNGPTGSVRLMFDAERSHFASLE